MSNLKKFIKDLSKKGGASYSLATGEYNPQSGYMVSLRGYETKVNYLGGDMGAAVKAFVMYNISTILNDDGVFIGGWKYEGEYYLDLSVNVANKSEAIELGKANGQIAIWDCTNSAEIKL